MDNKDYKSGISSQGLKPLAAVMFSAANGQGDDFMIRVGSTVLNRLESAQPEFAAENGLISDVINKGYAEPQSEEFSKFMEGAFGSTKEEKAAKRAMMLAAGLTRNTIERTPGEFFFTDSDRRASKKLGNFDWKQVEAVGQSGDHTFFSYKAKTPILGKLK